MAGVQDYVHSSRHDQRKSTQTSPPSQPQPQHLRPDREAAQLLKVSTRKPNTNSVSTVHPPRSTAPDVGWNAVASQTKYPNLQLVQHSLPSHRGGFDDTTVTSGFDDTKSDVQFGDEREGHEERAMHDLEMDEDDFEFRDGDEEEEEKDDALRVQNESAFNFQLNGNASPHVTHHTRHIQSKPTIYTSLDHYNAPRGHQTSSIAGRFYQAPNQQFPPQGTKLELRPMTEVDGINHQIRASKKRGRSHDPLYGAEIHEMYNQQQGMTQGELDAQLHCQRDPASGGRGQEPDDEVNGFNPSGDEAESASSEGRPNSHLSPPDNQMQDGFHTLFKDDRLNPDYNDEKLTTMTYADLKKETWETETHGQKLATPNGLEEPETSLECRIEHFLSKGEPEALVKFFGQMSKAEWEQSGEFFIETFGDLMRKIKHARKSKREMVNSFEDEIEAREQVVRGKSEKLDKDFRDMRVGGEGVLKGKTI